MTNQVTEKLINGQTHTIELATQELRNHFDDNHNCTKEILHQFNNLDYYTQFITPDDKIILDLGGNVGLFAIHVTPWAEKIITVEPTPSHFALNEQLTSQFNNITRLQAAVSNITGTTKFFLFESNSTMNSLIDRSGNFIMVDTITIPDIISKFKLKTVDFIKIDIEGSETIALDEHIISILSTKVAKILIEFHEVNGISYEMQRDRYEPIFQKFGYETKQFGPDGLFCNKKLK